MLGFVKNYLTKREGVKKYETALKSYLSDNKLDENEKAELEKILNEYGLTKEELLEAKKQAFSLSFEDITSDKKITDEEQQALQELINYFEVSNEDVEFDQKNFNKYFALGQIEKGILPDIKKHDLNVIFKEGEILHWGIAAALKKYKRVTERINYSGPTMSVKIMKGVRYRVGSIKVSSESKEYLITEDVGAFWMTNLRIGFSGQRKNFVIPYNKTCPLNSQR